jgi:hypothetical protein
MNSISCHQPDPEELYIIVCRGEILDNDERRNFLDLNRMKGLRKLGINLYRMDPVPSSDEDPGWCPNNVFDRLPAGLEHVLVETYEGIINVEVLANG